MIKKLIVFLLLSVSLFAQTIYTQKDVDVCTAKFKLAVEESLAQKPINEVVIAIAKSFLGLDYAEKTLEQGDHEQLVINLTGLDCYTFLETSLVFARCIKKGDTTFAGIESEVENIRYRNGELKDYPSRLHYFSDWIYEMDKRGIGKNITGEIGGIPYVKKINFMSTHPTAYERLKNNPAFVDSIRKTEEQISSRNYYYIPQDSIKKCESKIQSGDILGITTSINGLDISHTGIAVRMDDNRIHLFHSPSPGKQVQISAKPLAEYIQGVGQQTGIMVVRPLEIKCNEGN